MFIVVFIDESFPDVLRITKTLVITCFITQSPSLGNDKKLPDRFQTISIF